MQHRIHRRNVTIEGLRGVTAIPRTDTTNAITLRLHTADARTIGGDRRGLEAVANEVGGTTFITVTIGSTITISLITLRRPFEGIPIEAVRSAIAAGGGIGEGRIRIIEGMDRGEDTAIPIGEAASFMIITATITFSIHSLGTMDPMDPIHRVQGSMRRMDRMEGMRPAQHRMQRMLSMLPLCGINHSWAKLPS